MNIGHGAAGILMDPDGARAFISCGPDNYVAVLDLKTFRSRAISTLAESRTAWRGPCVPSASLLPSAVTACVVRSCAPG